MKPTDHRFSQALGVIRRTDTPTTARTPGPYGSHPHGPGPSGSPNPQSAIPNPQLLEPWLQSVSPTWDWTAPHLRLLQQELQAVTEGKVDRLMLFLPPRHGKSELVTVRYPVFRLERNPELRVIIGAYNQQLAERFSRKARRIASSRGLLRCSLPPELGGRGGLRAAAGEWETSHGGGVRAVGVGSGVTGLGADLILIDDPVKSREEAESQTYRNRVWDWYRDDLYTRQEPNCAIILVMTRWHEDDLAGRILASEEGPSWRVIRLPALAESPDEYRTYAERLYANNITDEHVWPGAQNAPHPCVPPAACSPVWELGARGPLASADSPAAQNAPHPPVGARSQPAEAGFCFQPGTGFQPGSRTPPSYESGPAELGARGPLPAATNEAVGPPSNPILHSPLSTLHFALSDPLGRAENEPLWPARFNNQALERIRTTLGTRSFAALYQGRPMPAEGGLFKREWFPLVAELPDPDDRRFDGGRPTTVRFWDTAAKAGQRYDYWVGALLVRYPFGEWYLQDVIRGRWEYPEAKRRVLETAAADGAAVTVVIEESANGIALLQDLNADPRADGYYIRAEKITAEKSVRAGAWAAAAEAGRFHLLRAPWNNAFLAELEAFPHATHDDQVDAVSGAYGYLTRVIRVRRPIAFTGPSRPANLEIPEWR